MKLRGEMQEITLKFENQKTITTTLEAAKVQVTKQYEEV